MSDPVTATIESAITECEAHRQKLEQGQTRLSSVFPLTERRLSGLDEQSVTLLDQFIYRFTKLQDSMARRLLPSLYQYLEADNQPRPFLDLLHRLEQLEIVSSVERWQQLRALRNNLAHDYPENTAQTVATLNELFDSWRDLEAMYTSAREAYERAVMPRKD
ncbi:MAG: hypothetical protein GVY29_01880 [Spirochaetes bacterium]|nr:hypothetical protein [Spirochaetota bacterium]